MELNREPLYLQIAEALRGEISSGVYGPGMRFPSERELAERYSVSRPTANKVLSSLAASGHILSRKGVGAFVAGPPLQHDMRALLSFTEKARRAGFVPLTRLLAMERTVDAELGEAIRLVRLRFIDGEPVIYEKRLLSAPLCAPLTAEAASGSLYAALSQGLGLQLGRAEQRARAVAPTAQERRRLSLRAGSACLRVEGRGYLADGRLLWIEDTLFRGDRFEIAGTLIPTA